MSRINPEQKLPSPRLSLITTIICSLEIILLGVFLLVVRYNPALLGSGFGALRILLPAILFTMWLISLTHGALMRSAVTLWMSYIFLVCAVVWVLANHPALSFSYKQLYPLYVAIPAFASAGTILFSRDKNTHLKSIILFGAVGLILFMHSMWSVDWVIILAIGVIVVGGFVITSAITSRKGRWDDGERSQRRLSEEDLNKLGYGVVKKDSKDDNIKMD